MADSPGFNIIRKGEKDRYKIGGVDKKRSSIDSANSFPSNTEILHTLTFSANKAPERIALKPLVFKSTTRLLPSLKTPCPFVMPMNVLAGSASIKPTTARRTQSRQLPHCSSLAPRTQRQSGLCQR